MKSKHILLIIATLLLIVCVVYGAIEGENGAESQNYYSGNPTPGFQGYISFKFSSAMPWWVGGVLAFAVLYGLSSKNLNKSNDD